ncbi:MAG: nicotinamide-nucleotide amidase, partial [Solirubrobacterales bacterium]|nr:nicotinamide-nucleotide amidase [Solirubrobacterales bacterium]
GGSEDKPVGYVCFCAKTSDGRSLERQPLIPGGREDVRERSALVALHMLRVLLGGEEAPL